MGATATLSAEEQIILKLAAWGATYKVVSSRTSLPQSEVCNRFRSIYKKLQLTKINELSAWYFCTTYDIPQSDSPLN